MNGSKKQVRIGFLGAGWWTTANHLPLLTQRAKEIGDVKLVGVCRLGKEELKTVQNEFNLEKGTEDYHEFLGWDLDGVIIATPHHLHYEHTKAALEAGIHAMVEKPFVLNARHGWELVNIADKKNLHLLIPHGWHYKDFIIEAHNIVKSGVIGQIEHVMCHTATPMRELFSGEGFKMVVGGIFESDLSIYSTLAKGGGYSWGQLPHSIAMMLWVTGLTPDEVFAFMSTAGSSEKVDMHEAITVRFKENAIGVISGSSGVPVGNPFQVDIRIFGSKGMLLLDVERERMQVNYYNKVSEDFNFNIKPGDGAYSCDGPPNRFIELIKGEEKENNSDGRIGALVTSILEAAHNSVQSGNKEPVILHE